MGPLLLLLVRLGAAQPPPEVLNRLDQAIDRLADASEVAVYRVTTRVDASDADGSDAHVDIVLTEVTLVPGGKPVSRNLSHTRDGEPVEDKPSKAGSGEFSLTPPAGEDLHRYVYGETSRRGALDTAPFEPADLPGADSLARGTLAWSPTTLEPVWLSFRPVELGLLVQSLDVLLEFGATDGRLHTRRVTVNGVGGLPGMRKKFKFTFHFHDLKWAP